MYCCSTKKTIYFFHFVFAAVGLLSCESQRQPATFYPIDSLVSAQAKYLSSVRAGLFKEALLSGEADTIRFIPKDTTAWIKELDIFRKLEEINKPINKMNYSASDGLFDPGSNLKVKAFTRVEEVPVVYLKIYYQGGLGKLRKIEARYEEENLLYGSARLLAMHFQQIDNKTVLTSYSVKGGQKMLFGDTVTFYISGKILVD